MSAMTTSKLSQRTVTAMSSGYLANELNGLVLPASNRKRAKWARSEICNYNFYFFLSGPCRALRKSGVPPKAEKMRSQPMSFAQ